MKIEYFGHSCFRLTASNGVSVLTDPYTKVGYELPCGLHADIVTISHGHFDHNYVNGVQYSYCLDAATKNEIKGIEIVGEPSYHDPEMGRLRGENILFKIKMDGVTVCHFGDLGESFFKDMAEKLSGADVWLIPVGGTYTIDAKQAIEYIRAMKPKAVIPMHYRPKDGMIDIAPIKEFLDDVAMETVGPISSFHLTQADLTDGVTKVYYMERIV